MATTSSRKVRSVREMKSSMIPSPYPLSGPIGPAPQITREEMAQIAGWVEALKRSFNLSEVMLVMKTIKKHPDCNDPKCDHHDKVILNLQLNKEDLEELSDNIRGFLL